MGPYYYPDLSGVEITDVKLVNEKWNEHFYYKIDGISYELFFGKGGNLHEYTAFRVFHKDSFCPICKKLVPNTVYDQCDVSMVNKDILLRKLIQTPQARLRLLF